MSASDDKTKVLPVILATVAGIFVIGMALYLVLWG